jgi:methylglutaconyl-CoA hydratase
MSNEHILYEIDHQGVAIVTLNRPDKHNAFDELVIADLTAAFEQIGEEENVRVMVLRANGKNFCAGADVNWMKRVASYSHEENIRDANALAKMLHTLNFLPVPTIARVQGAAMGGGAGLVCCCDIAIASDNASFAFSEAKLGLIPATISPYVVRAIGNHAARRYFLTAERFTAERAEALGMVSEVLTSEQLDQRIEELIDIVIKNSSKAVRSAKQLLYDIEGKVITEELMQDTSERIANIRASDQGKEGLKAFLEKRKPSWVK